MKTRTLFLLATLYLLIASCSKSDNPGGDDNSYIELNVNGVKYRDDISSFGSGFSGFTTCASKEGFQQYLTTIETSNFEAEFYLLHLMNDNDFKSSTPGTYRIVEEKYYGLGEPRCTNNFDMFLTFLDKKQSQQYCSLDQSGNTNKVERITLLKTTTQEKTYSVEGSFNATVTNAIGTKYKLDGKYKVIVSVLR
jgi:hypothetical protein